ncbi:hypothetical protein L596_021079 [Steinernema carpocapsae]|uniref:non-specific serine/threonine protein kinase n=1 Tax=Steinernema carpocapsae TaxID=34508 RepID=A0A4U5MVG1_STECR|nr:hypothetical protein L596_021079 [Steinernema carpocapsae]
MVPFHQQISGTPPKRASGEDIGPKQTDSNNSSNRKQQVQVQQQKPKQNIGSNNKGPNRRIKRKKHDRTVSTDDDGIIEYENGPKKSPSNRKRQASAKKNCSGPFSIGSKLKTPNNIYSFVRHVGSGGYGEVYHVRDSGGRDYAMKTETVKPGKDQKPEVLVFEEIAKAKKLNPEGYPHLISMFENGQIGMNRFIVMTLTGPSLDSVIKKHKLTFHAALRICIHALDGIEEFHRLNIVHRDIKAENYLTSYRGRKLIYLADFGMSCHAPEQDERLPNRLTHFWALSPTHRGQATKDWCSRRGTTLNHGFICVWNSFKRTR